MAGRGNGGGEQKQKIALQMKIPRYMRECILGNFKRRLIAVLKTDNDLQRPSVLELLIRRHTAIVHLAEQHISMDLTLGIREILLSETFSGPVSSLHLFEKPAEQHTGSAAEAVCNWYVENIVKDISGAGVLFAALLNCIDTTLRANRENLEAVGGSMHSGDRMESKH
ncbi:hypothetical protein M9H77_17395 [Catharanthus roseus]|uniref:Uncharacterized protein n=1 Tax=Catharanthus roseus TaxID=4058 RepID=A0ACC0B4I1_CATRO|nr:hypothetical protein M9H77_17395 [Catharanthus roseus]